MHRTYRTELAVDTDATAIAKVALVSHPDPHDEGHLSALWSLAQLIPSSRTYYQVAATRAHGATTQERLDLEVSLRHLTIDKVVQRRKDGTWYLDLTRLAEGSSFSGWLRSTAEAALLSERRNLRVSTREQHPTGEILAEDATITTAASETETAVCDQALTFLRASTARTDVQDASWAQAVALSRGLGLQLPSRAVLDADARQRLVDLLSADPTLAHRSARRLLDGDVHDLDDNLVTLMDTVPETDIEEWVEHGPQVAHTMLFSALALTPQVKRATMRILKSSVRGLAEDGRAGRLTSALIDAWDAWRCDVVGSKYGIGAAPALKSEDQQDVDTQAFYDALVAYRRHPYATYLGSTMREVADWLEDTHAVVEHAMANDVDIELAAPAPRKRTRIPASRSHLIAI